MARIRELFKTANASQAHPTEVDCGWQVIPGDPTLLQLSTYGSDQRASHKKVSQTLQLDRQRALQLADIIANTFPRG
jgi:hypothetical protein